METIMAWYFAPKGNRLWYGDNRLIRAGSTHTVEGTPKICEHGLHGSERIIDALNYAQTSILYRVELSGEMDEGNDKIAAQSRKYIKRYNVEETLREFTRKQALINIEKIKPYCSIEDYALIMEYLLTGKNGIRSAELAARSALWSALWSAAWSAARSAARSTAWSAAWSAEELAELAVRSTAWSAARSAELAERSAANSMLEEMILEIK